MKCYIDPSLSTSHSASPKYPLPWWFANWVAHPLLGPSILMVGTCTLFPLSGFTSNHRGGLFKTANSAQISSARMQKLVTGLIKLERQARPQQPRNSTLEVTISVKES